MGHYVVTDKETGKKLKLTGDSPPTDAELEQIFSEQSQSEQIPQTPAMNVADDIYTAQEQMMPGMSVMPRFAEGAYRGYKNAITGGQQLFNTIDVHADDEERSNKALALKSEIAANDMRTMNLGGPGIVGSMVGEVAPSMLLPGGPTGGLARRVAGGVAMDTVASLADPVREGETRAGNLGVAAGFSSGLRVGGGGLSVGFRRLSNARAGNVSDADTRRLIDSASAEDIRLFFQDTTDSAMARKASVAAESVFGTGNLRKQNKEAYEAASRWLSDVSGDGDDYAELVQAGIRRKLDIFKRRASQMYGKVGDAIGDAGDVPRPKFDASVNQAIAAETAKGTRANPQVIDFLERYRDAPTGNFDEMIEFRSEMLRDLRKLEGSITSDRALSHSSQVSISNVIDTINNDMETFARQFGADGAWRKANRFYYDNVVEFKKGKLKGFLNENSAANFDQQAAWRYLRSQPNDNRARAMWQSLDAKGRNAVRAGLLQEALEVATPTTGPFSPAKYASYLEKQMPNIEQFFRGRKREEIKGLINLMRHVERSGQVLENPPTGMRVLPFLFGAGAVASPAAAATGGTALGGMKLLFETKSGRNLLLAANTATPGSREFDRVMQNMETFLSRASN